MEIFKSLTGIAGEKKIFLSINPKGESERLIDARCGITFDCQDIPKGLNDGGYDRRAVYLMLTEANKSERAVELSQSLENFGSQQDIFNWLVGMDVTKMLETFNTIKKSEMVLQTTIKVRREEPLSQFIIDTVEVTNEPTDKMSCNDLYETYNEYIVKSGDYKMSRTKFIKELQKILQSKTHGFNWTGEKKNMKLNSIQVNGLTGLMFKTETTSFDELAEE
ncbi:MAG: hypothetical protein HC907_17875 [Richelia sp. SM1_7_0]|nr:hypothetical protein [Richelia sp. SM1_7_0]